MAPALAAGVTTVIKLPGNTAQINYAFSQVLAEAADLPWGVINIFSESGSAGSVFLMQSKDIRVVSFTGSTKTGKAISAAWRVDVEIISDGARRQDTDDRL